jgi:hypothetical protein
LFSPARYCAAWNPSAWPSGWSAPNRCSPNSSRLPGHHPGRLPPSRSAHGHSFTCWTSTSTALPCDIALDYDLLINGQGIADWAPHLLYPGTTRPDLVLRERLDQVLHGSCRKPHHPRPTACCAPTACWPPAPSRNNAPPCC